MRGRVIALLVLVALAGLVVVALDRRGAADRADSDPPAREAAGRESAPAGRPPGLTAEEPAPVVPATQGLVVRVLHADGTPAAGADVLALPATDGLVQPPASAGFTAKTDRDGRATIEGAPAWCNVRATFGGQASAPVMTGSGAPLEFRLEPAVALRGQVLLPDDRPANEAILLFVFVRDNDSVHLNGKADAQGRFELPPIPRSRLDRLLVVVDHAHDGRWMPRNLFELHRAELMAQPVLTLRMTAIPVRGRVVDAGGEPIAGVEVFDLRRWASPKPLAATNADGRFEFESQQWLDLPLLFKARGFAAKSVGWSVRPEQGEVVVRLAKGASVTYRVAGARRVVALDPTTGSVLATARAEADGSFRFANLPSGELRLRITFGGIPAPPLVVDGFRAGSAPVEIPAPEWIRVDLPLFDRATGSATRADHVTMIFTDRRNGEEVLEHTWPRGVVLEMLRARLPRAGTYDILVTTAGFEPARLEAVQIAPERVRIPLHLQPRR